MEDEEYDHNSHIGQLIQRVNKLIKKPQIDNELSNALDVFQEKVSREKTYLKNGIFNINFAEAALFLQSCGELYGKKIDLLWDQLLEFHTRLIEYDCRDAQEKGKKVSSDVVQKLEERRNRYKRKKTFKLALAESNNNIEDFLFDKPSAEEEKPAVFGADDELYKAWRKIELESSEITKVPRAIVKQQRRMYRMKNYYIMKSQDWDINDTEDGEFNTKYSRIPGWHIINHIFEYNTLGLLPDKHNTIATLRLCCYLRAQFMRDRKIPFNAPYSQYKEEYLVYKKQFFEEEAKKWQNMPLDTMADLRKQLDYLAQKEREEQTETPKKTWTIPPFLHKKSCGYEGCNECSEDSKSSIISICNSTDIEFDDSYKDELSKSKLSVCLEKLSSEIVNTKLRQDSGFYEFNDSDCSMDTSQIEPSNIPEINNSSIEANINLTETDKTNQMSTETDKTNEASTETDKTNDASTETAKNNDASSENDKTNEASAETDKINAAAAETGKANDATADTDKTNDASAETDKTNDASAETNKTNEVLTENETNTAYSETAIQDPLTASVISTDQSTATVISTDPSTETVISTDPSTATVISTDPSTANVISTDPSTETDKTNDPSTATDKINDPSTATDDVSTKSENTNAALVEIDKTKTVNETDDNFDIISIMSDHDYCHPADLDDVISIISDHDYCHTADLDDVISIMSDHDYCQHSDFHEKRTKKKNFNQRNTMVPMNTISRIIPRVVRLKTPKEKIDKDTKNLMGPPPPKRRKLSQKQIEKLLASKIVPVKEMKFEKFFTMNYQPQLGEGDIQYVDYESEDEVAPEDILAPDDDVRSIISDHSYCHLPIEDSGFVDESVTMESPRVILDESVINQDPPLENNVKENVEPLQTNVEPPHENVELSPENVESLQENVEPLQDNVEPLHENVEPPQKNVEPSQENVEPPQENVEPPQKNVESIQGNVEPPLEVDQTQADKEHQAEYNRLLTQLRESRRELGEELRIDPGRVTSKRQRKEQERLAAKARVDQWKDTINPILRNLKENDFDIHEYGGKVMDGMDVEEIKPFKNIVDGKSSAEVVRYFIASLQLANTYNIEICGAKKGELSNETFNVKLLKKERYHEHLSEYHAPSEDDFREKLKKIRQMQREEMDEPVPKRHRNTNSISHLENTEDSAYSRRSSRKIDEPVPKRHRNTNSISHLENTEDSAYNRRSSRKIDEPVPKRHRNTNSISHLENTEDFLYSRRSSRSTTDTPNPVKGKSILKKSTQVLTVPLADINTPSTSRGWNSDSPSRDSDTFCSSLANLQSRNPGMFSTPKKRVGGFS